jgi:TP901 family phage tail tape measure protein
MAATVAELDILFNAETGEAMAAFGGMQDALFRTAMAGQKMGDFFMGGTKSMVNSAIDFETQMRNINSIAQADEAQLASWGESIQELAMTWGESSVSLAGGMYQIQSAGFSAADSLAILESASMAARAGLTTTEVAADAVTSVLNSYQGNLGATTQAYQELTSAGERAEYIQNVLFRGVDRGKMTYEELAGSIGRVAGVAATADLSIEDVTGSIALMTQQGLSADESVTALYNTVNAFIKPTEAMTTAVQELGYETPLAMIETLGFAGAIQALEGYTGGAADAIGELFGNIRGQRGATLLMNGDLNAMIAAMEEAQGGAGKLSAMEMALEQQTMSTQFAIDVFKATFEVLGQELVQSFLPVIRLVLGAFVDLAQMFVSLPQPVKDFMGATIAMFGVIMSGVGAVALFLALFKPILPLLALLSGSALVVAAAFAALFAVFTKFGFRDVIQGFSDMVDMLDLPFLDHFTNSVERAAEAWDRFTGLIQTGTGFTQLDGFALSIGKLGAALIAFAESTSDLDFLDGPLGDLGEFFKDIAGPIDKFLDLWDRLKGEGTTTDTSSLFGVPDVFDDGDFKPARTRITAFALAWEGMVDALHEEFPNQAPLINATDGAVKGLIGTVSAAMAGDWDAAWASFQVSMDQGLEAAKIVMGNIRDTVVEGFNAIDWAAVGSTVEDGIAGAFGLITQGLDWVVDVAAPEVLGWLYENSGAIWEGIKAVGGYVFEKFTQGVEWIIDVGIPGIQGAGENILKNVRGWLIGQITGQGYHTRGFSGVGESAALHEMSLGKLTVTWILEIGLPLVTGAITGIAGRLADWIRGYIYGGADNPHAIQQGYGPNTDAGGIVVEVGKIIIDVLDAVANVTNADVQGWVQEAIDLAGSVEAFLEDTVLVVVDPEVKSDSEGEEGGGGFTGWANRLWQETVDEWGTVVAEATAWKIALGDLLSIEPDPKDEAESRLTEMVGTPIATGVGWIVDFGQAVGSARLDNAFFILSDLLRKSIADVEPIADLPNWTIAITAIPNIVFNFGWNVAEYLHQRLVAWLGGYDWDMEGPPWGISFTSTPEISLPDTLSLRYLIREKLPDLLIDGVEWALKLDIVQATFEFVGDIIEAIRSHLPTISISDIPWSLSFGMPDINLPSGEAIKAWLYEAGQDVGIPDRVLDRLLGEQAGSDFAQGMTGGPGNAGATPSRGGTFSDEGTGGVQIGGGVGVTTMPNTGGKPIPDRVSGISQELLSGLGTFIGNYQAEIGRVVPLTQIAAKNIAPAWDTGFRDFGSGVVQQTRTTSDNFGAGLAPIPRAAQDTGAGATTGLSGGLLGMVGAAALQATGAAGSLRTGIAPMPGDAQSAGQGANSNMSKSLSPMPGTVGGIATTTGNSFATGITQGFFLAAQAAWNGAASIRAAATSIGSLYSVGFSVGSSMGEGIAAGLYSQVGAVAQAAAALVSAAAGAASIRAQIGSPSRLMRDEIGIPLADGVIAGIEQRTPAINAAMAAAVGGFDGRTGAYTLPRSKVVAINNNNYYILEPEAWMEVQRDSKMAASQLRDLNSQARLRTRSKPQLSKTT